MKPYLLSLGAGLVVGVVYSLMNVRPPAPPVIALIGLFRMLAGEQIIPLVERMAGPRADHQDMVQKGVRAAHVRHAADRRLAARGDLRCRRA